MNILQKNVKELNERERFKLIQQLEINKQALNFLQNQLKNLSIEILGHYEGNVIDLMNDGLLEGWCWQTTESSIVFLKDDDYIARGNLKLSPYKKYWHSWICFEFNNKILVFDPCLQILVDKELYYHIFEISKVEGIATSKSVREDLIYRINHPKKREYEDDNSFVAKFVARFASERQKNETQVIGNNDVNSPMYRNNTGYTATIEDNKIIMLIAHYYLGG